MVAERAIDVDAWATALFVMGPETAREVAAARDDLSVILLEPDTDGRLILWIEKDLRDRYTPQLKTESYLIIRVF